MANKPKDSFLKVGQVAERLNVAARTIYDLCQQGKIKHVRVGAGRGAIRISEQALEEYLTDSEVKPPRLLRGGLADLIRECRS